MKVFLQLAFKSPEMKINIYFESWLDISERLKIEKDLQNNPEFTKIPSKCHIFVKYAYDFPCVC